MSATLQVSRDDVAVSLIATYNSVATYYSSRNTPSAKGVHSHASSQCEAVSTWCSRGAWLENRAGARSEENQETSGSFFTA